MLGSVGGISLYEGGYAIIWYGLAVRVRAGGESRCKAQPG